MMTQSQEFLLSVSVPQSTPTLVECWVVFQCSGEEEASAEVEETASVSSGAGVMTGDTAGMDSAMPVKVGRSQPIFGLPTPKLQQNVAMDDILKRFWPVGSVVWKSSNVLSDELWSFRFPNDLFKKVPFLGEKFKNFAFTRFGFTIQIQINGSVGQYGRLVLGSIPMFRQTRWNNTKPDKFTIYHAYTSDWLNVDVASGAPAEKSFKYINFTDRMLVANGNTDKFADMYKLSLQVAAPLTAASGVAPDVTVTMYVALNDVELFHPTVAGARTYDVTQVSGIVKKQSEAKKKTVQGIIGERVEGKKTDGGTFPKFTDLGVAIDAGVGAVADILSFIGLNNTVSIKETDPIQVRYPRPLQTADNALTIAAYPDSTRSLVKNFQYVFDDPEALSFKRYFQRPSLLASGKISASDTAGKVVFNHFVTPLSFCKDVSVGLDKGNLVPCTTANVARFFRVWRGGMRYVVSFVASPLQSLRVRICYVPNSNAIISDDVIDRSNARWTVVDVRGNKNFVFEIPFDSTTHWKHVVGGVLTPDETSAYNYSNGRWWMEVANQLSSNTGTPNPISYQVYISGADDLQFGLPDAISPIMLKNLDATYDVKQMSGLEVWSVDDCVTDCDRMRAVQYPAFTSSVSHECFEDDVCNTNFHSFRQLTNMPSFLDAYPTITNPTKDYIGYNISANGTFNFEQASSNHSNFLISVLNMFTFSRGSYRIMAIPCNNGEDPYGKVSRWFTYTRYVRKTDAPAKIGIDISPAVYSMHAYSSSDIKLNPLDITVPFGSIVPTVVNTIGTNVSSTIGYNPTTYFAIFNKEAEDKPLRFDLLLGGGDDLIFGVQRPVCTMYSNL